MVVEWMSTPLTGPKMGLSIKETLSESVMIMQ